MNQRLDPNIRRNVIIAAAIKRVLTNEEIITFSDESVVELCEVKTSVATLRRYFPRRQDLITAMCEQSEEIEKLAKEKGIV